MAVRGYEISLGVVNNNSRVSAANERNISQLTNVDLFTYEDSMFFSRVKISCFHAKEHLVCPFSSNFLTLNLISYEQSTVGVQFLFSFAERREGRQHKRVSENDRFFKFL